MIALLLAATAGIFREFGTSIGKHEAQKKRETLYAMAFLGSFWTALLMIGIALFSTEALIFSLASLPTFMVRAVLELVLIFVSVSAIRDSDRSTFTFLRTLTIPLLLVTDILLGYPFSTFQIAGIFVILVALLFLFNGKGLSKKGKLLSIFSATLAVATISLYKYNITHFNSVEAEQAIMHSVLLVSIIIIAAWRGHENVLRHLLNPLYVAQSFAFGIATVAISFAYLFAPASVILTAKRSFEAVSSLISGSVYFREQHMGLKIFTLVFVILGIALMAS